MPCRQCRRTRYKIVQDPEATITQFSVYYRDDQNPNLTASDYRERLVRALVTGMMNRRLAAIARNGETSPFLWGRISRSTLVRHHAAYVIAGQVHEDSLLSGMEAVLREFARAQQHGFTTQELDRQKRVIHRSRERRLSEKNHTSSSLLARQLIQFALTDAAIPGPDAELELTQQLLDGVTVDDVSGFLSSMLEIDDRIFVVTMPEKTSLASLAPEDIAASADRAWTSPLAPYQDPYTERPLMETVPTPVDIASRQTHPELEVTEVTLSNGIRLILRPTTFKGDEVLFTSFSDGGTSLYPDEEYFDATFASLIVQRSGVGSFDQTELRQKLAGQIATVSPNLTELYEGFSGRSSKGDLETLFQLIHLYATDPRADQTALQSFKNHQLALLANRESDPATAFSDSLFRAFYGDHPRRRLMTSEDIDNITTEKSLTIYKERFASFGDFTFVFVGSFEVDDIVTLARTYLGTLPGDGPKESWRDVEPELPQEPIIKTVFKGQEPQSRVALVFHGPIEYTLENEHRLQSLQMVLNMRLREELRETRSGIYSASVQAGAQRDPRPQYTISVYFDCAPERVHELSDALFAEIDKIKKDAPIESYLRRVQEQQRQMHRLRLETNGYWLAVLQRAYQSGDSIQEVLDYEKLVDALEPNDIRSAANTWLGDRYIRVFLMPNQ